MAELTDEEVEGLRQLLKSKDTLDRLAKKEDAFKLLSSMVRTVALWIVAVVGAGTALWTMFSHLVKGVK